MPTPPRRNHPAPEHCREPRTLLITTEPKKYSYYGNKAEPEPMRRKVCHGLRVNGEAAALRWFEYTCPEGCTAEAINAAGKALGITLWW